MSRRVSSLLPKRLQAKKLKIRLYKYGLILAVLLIVILGVSFLARAQFARVQTVAINGNEIVKKEAIEDIVNGGLNSSFAWIFPKDNFVLFPKSETEKIILAQFPTIANVSVAFSGLNKLSVNIREHAPTYVWCETLAREHCYFMDERGYIFNESADFSKTVLFSYYGLIDPAVPIGKTFLPEAKFAELNKFIISLKLLKLTPVGLNARGEDDFELRLSPSGSILFSNREPALTTFENLETIIAEQTRLDRDFLNKFDYIDVRFSSKAFVKLK